MTYHFRSIGTQADLLRFPIQSAADPAEPVNPDPRDKRPVEIERIHDNDQMLPSNDEPVGDEPPQPPPGPVHDDRALF